MEQHIELFNLATFLHNFQEVIPIYRKRKCMKMFQLVFTLVERNVFIRSNLLVKPWIQITHPDPPVVNKASRGRACRSLKMQLNLI